MATEEAKQEIQQLVAKYEALSARAIKGYNEANTKDGFVRPLFEALGWDFSNLDEVEGEKTITPGRVDYLFKVNGVSKFCLEVKALHVDINDERWIRQAITYAYYKAVTWAVLTNFKTLRAFNAERETRDIKQIAFLNLTCESYLTDFHRLWLLSREAVASGDLDKEAVAYGRLPPRLLIEKRLYAQLIGWRETLFNEVYLYYKDKGFTWSQVDQWIQQLLNRLIFIRTAEDRGLIDRKLLAALHQWRGSDGKDQLMDRLRDIFHEFANLYDSDLFPQIMDPWDSISVYNSRVLADIIQGLYEVPGGLADWDFATIGSDVLGTVYEQYLGYVPARVKEEAKEAQQLLFPTEPHIGLTAKKEKRKGGGIYYTPTWVVDYIVKQTVGRFIEEHSYNDILNIKILDPACGSGSFLTRAYEELLDYHARQQGKSPAELEQWERTRILLRNIYGVDLDQQAVEIARLSLLLCSLSGQETLPSLADNIRWGNSLISGTEEELRSYFGDGWREKKPFNWGEEFPQIMKEGGFDVVIGNPPYVRSGSLPADEKKFYSKAFLSAFKQYDIYTLFIETGIRLLRNGGRLGFIVSSKFFASDYGEKLRKLILDTCAIEKTVNVSELPVFKEAAVYPYILVLRKEDDEGERNKSLLEAVYKLQSQEALLLGKYDFYQLPQARFLEPPHILDITSPAPDIVERLRSVSVALGSICKVTRGFRPPPSDLLIGEQAFAELSKEEQKKYHRMVDGKDIKGPYALAWKGIYLRYEKPRIPEAKPAKVFESPKLMITDISYRPEAYFDLDGFYCLKTIYLVLLRESTKYDLRYITGLLNSKLSEFFFRSRFFAMHIRGGYLRFRKQFLDQFPIRRIDFDNRAEQKVHDDLVALVERMLELNKRLTPIRNTPCNERDELVREIERTDRQIDNLVFDLYGLTEQERRIVEESTKT
jgi:type I restriction-modification system DNA methylase subunit